jgi:hypothetical protein
MQLVAYGAQDVYLTGDPQITFFKVVYRRHTNFAMEPVEQTFNGTADFGRTVNCTLSRVADLVGKIYLNVELRNITSDTNWGYVHRLGHALIESCSVEIGGQKVDTQYGDWLNIWHELARNNSHDAGYDCMVGDVHELTDLSQEHPEYNLYVPLQFWFNRHNGLALPLIALQYHEVKINMKLRDAEECINYSGSGKPSELPSMQDAKLVVDYIFLDTEERRRFAQSSHEYLIEQVQFTGSESIQSTNTKHRLNFNHPCKYLAWVIQVDRYRNGSKFVATNADDFAKHVWLAAHMDDAGKVAATNASGEDAESTFFDQGVTMTATGDAATMAGKVEAFLVFDADDAATRGTAVSKDNVTLLKNGISCEDMSHTLDEIEEGMSDGGKAYLRENAVCYRDYCNYSMTLMGEHNPLAQAKLQLNGHDRFSTRDGNYFNYVQPYQHFSNTPADGVNVYSFALEPEKHQPSGSCNFSRIDNATLNLDVNGESSDWAQSNSVVNVYAVNYNVLRCLAGMAGVAYSN